LKEKLAEIELDLKNGFKFKAADRLRKMINQYPNETKIWNRLAEIYYESGFFASAGKYWILTEPKEDRIKQSVEIYEKSVNYSGTKILEDITFRGDKAKLSEFGKKKLVELESDSKKESNYIPSFLPITNNQKEKERSLKIIFKDKLMTSPIIGIFIFLALCLIIVVIMFIQWIF
tara:strand:+ start:7770 stop:8294 length:525 start_codon:yes stop_codon:yes gene_type:complete